MNLAFPAAFLFAVLLPGLIFLRAYDRSRETKDGLGRLPTSPIPDRLQDEIARSPVPAVGLHMVWIWVCNLIGHPVDLKASIALVLGSFGKENYFFDAALNSVTTHSLAVAWYFLSIWCGAAVLGYALSRIVWGNRLDLKLRILRPEGHDWFYLFRGEHPAHKTDSRIVGVRVSAVVVCGGETLIYQGFYRNHTGRGGTLDEIWLEHAERRRLLDDNIKNPDTETFYKVHGNLLILKASEIRTVNLRYVDVKSVEKAKAALRARKSPSPSGQT